MFRIAAIVSLLLALAIARGAANASAAAAEGRFAGGRVREAPDVETFFAPAFAPREFARALLAETNRVRREHGRRSLKSQAELEAAADDQAAFMALRQHVQHGSFLRGQATAAERVRRHGLEGSAVAENVAMTTLSESLEGLNAEKIAAMLVEQWMNSPGHRANVLDRRLTHFGGSVRLTRRVGGQWAAYGAQVFLIARPAIGRGGM